MFNYFLKFLENFKIYITANQRNRSISNIGVITSGSGLTKYGIILVGRAGTGRISLTWRRTPYLPLLYSCLKVYTLLIANCWCLERIIRKNRYSIHLWLYPKTNDIGWNGTRQNVKIENIIYNLRSLRQFFLDNFNYNSIQ